MPHPEAETVAFVQSPSIADDVNTIQGLFDCYPNSPASSDAPHTLCLQFEGSLVTLKEGTLATKSIYHVIGDNDEWTIFTGDQTVVHQTSEVAQHCSSPCGPSFRQADAASRFQLHEILTQLKGEEVQVIAPPSRFAQRMRTAKALLGLFKV